MAGIRASTVGIDIGSYALPHFNRARNSLSFIEYISTNGSPSLNEIGWHALTYISTKTFDSLNWNFFFYNFFTCTFFYVGAWKHRKFASLPLIMLVFFLMQYNLTYNLMRQAIACSIIFMGFDNLEKRKYLKFFIYIIAASCFHASALFAVVFMLGFQFAIAEDFGKVRGFVDILLCSLILLCFVVAPILQVILLYITPLSKYIGYARSGSQGYHTVGIMLIGEIMLFL